MRLCDIVDFNPRTTLPRSGELPFVDMAALPTSARNIAEIAWRSVGSSGAKFKNGDTLLARITPCLENGKGAKVSHLPEPGIGQGSTEFIVMRAKKASDEDFVYYLSRHPTFRAFAIQQMVGTSGRQRVAWQSLVDFEIDDLDITQRQSAGEVLSALDDKIELNRRMNETLEAMAQAIFRDWFVDFGPVRRKLDGTTDPVAIMGGLLPDPARAAELAGLFPDALGEDELPAGWEVDRLGSIADLQNGYAFKSSDWSDSGVPVIKIGSVKPGFVDLSSASFVSPTLAEERASFRLSPGDMVVGLTGYVGETGRVPMGANPPLLNQRVARFRPRQGMSAAVFAAVRDVAFKQFAESKAHGSAQPNVSTKDLLTFPIVFGSDAILAKFDLLVGPLFDWSLSGFQENTLLAEIRDYLLPRLMSGAVRVGEALDRVEDAA